MYQHTAVLSPTTWAGICDGNNVKNKISSYKLVIFLATTLVKKKKMDLLGYLVVAFGNHWQQYIFFTLHLRKLVSAPYRSLRIPPFCQVCLFTFFPYQIELPSSPASGDTDAGLQYHTWDLEQGCTPIWVRERERKKVLLEMMNTLVIVKSTFTVRKTALTLLYEQFSALVSL